MTEPSTYVLRPGDPGILAPFGQSEEQWRAWAEGMPLSKAMGFKALELADGRGRFRVDEAPMGIANPNGSIHGGQMVAIADQCMGCVTMTLLSEGQVGVTASIHSQYHRPAMPPVTFEARVTKQGRTLVFVDVDVFDVDGRLCNSAQGTMMIMQVSGGRPDTAG